MPLYATAMMAENQTQYLMMASMEIAKNKTEAIGLAMEQATLNFPFKAGFYAHQVSVAEVPDRIIEKVYKEL